MYLFPSSPHAHHCRKAHRDIDGECVQIFLDTYCSLQFELLMQAWDAWGQKQEE